MTIIPENEQVRRAVKWISDQLKEDEHLSKNRLINEAILRFDLNPSQAVFLLNFYKEQ